MGKIAATTRDGERCNDCGGAVAYNPKRFIHEHIEADPDCPKGRELEARAFGREPAPPAQEE